MSASPSFYKIPSHWSSQKINFGDDPYKNPPLRIWQNPEGKTGQALYIVHGWGEQSDRYEHFAHYLQFCVDIIVAVDLLGHGLFPGLKGHFDDFQQITQAATNGFLKAKDIYKNKNWHWFGHSFGGLTTLKVIKSYNLTPKSWLISAPLLQIALPVPAAKEFFGKLITPILPKLQLSQEIDGSTLSKDPTVGIAYKNNPLNHSKITPKAYQQMNLAMNEVRIWEGPLSAGKFLFIVPLSDQVVSAPVNTDFVIKLKAEDQTLKTVQFLPGVCHESFNDLEKDRVFNLIENWINNAGRS